MSQKEEFHNIDNPADGLFRELAAGVTTRIFSGEQAMLSVVTLAPHAQGTLHHHPEEQWGVLLDGSAGAPWQAVVAALDRQLRSSGKKAVWFDAGAARKGDGFDPDSLANIRPDAQADLCVATGPGASQVPWPDAAKISLA